MAWAMGNTFLTLLTPGMKKELIDQTAKLNIDAQDSPLLGFNFNPENIKIEQANCMKIYNEMDVSMGRTPPAQLNARIKLFRQKLKDAGADKIIAEMQKQIDAYLKANK